MSLFMGGSSLLLRLQLATSLDILPRSSDTLSFDDRREQGQILSLLNATLPRLQRNFSNAIIDGASLTITGYVFDSGASKSLTKQYSDLSLPFRIHTLWLSKLRQSTTFDSSYSQTSVSAFVRTILERAIDQSAYAPFDLYSQVLAFTLDSSRLLHSLSKLEDLRNRLLSSYPDFRAIPECA
ncbi:hypothetical protein V1514DRAFT_319091 [Lipomyces japonicus]|uniref:uncharacterized protein n=1 Tax=Lipomyces japonicus TaxID=56871 RepID=UPI0034CF5E62